MSTAIAVVTKSATTRTTSVHRLFRIPAKYPLASGGDGTERRCVTASVVQHGQIEALQALGVDQDVDLHDLVVRHGEAHHRERAAARRHYHAGPAVHQRGPPMRREVAEAHRLSDHGLGA